MGKETTRDDRLRFILRRGGVLDMVSLAKTCFVTSIVNKGPRPQRDRVEA
jgi:hypothetical protein